MVCTGNPWIIRGSPWIAQICALCRTYTCVSMHLYIYKTNVYVLLFKMNVAFASPASARIFLSAFAICNFPSIALGQNGGLKETVRFVELSKYE